MEVIVKAQTKKYGNFTILFDDYTCLQKFRSEILRNLQFAEMQTMIKNDCQPMLFKELNKHYSSQYHILDEVTFYCDCENGCRFCDYAEKNIFEVEQKLS